MNIRLPDALQAVPTTMQDLPGRWQRAHPRLRRVLAGLAIVGAGLLAWSLLAHRATAPRQEPPPPVRVAVAQQRNVTAFERTIGTVVAVSTVQVTALVTGQLLSTGFIEGQIVRKGDVLFRIDPKPFAAALKQAQAALARDRANALSAANDRVRYSALAAQGAASAMQRDQAVATADADAAIVQADKAAIAAAELNLGYTVIRSPIDGKTGPILVQPGNLITANNSASPLVTITQLQPIKVSMFLPQSDLPRIQQQMRAKKLAMNLKLGSGAPLAAPIDFVGNQVDAKTGTIELRATFDNADDRLVPGQLVDAGAALDDYPNTIVVPREAVNIGPDSRFVFVLNRQNRAQMRPVTVLYDNGTTVGIRGGVARGDRVITEGQLRVLPGHAVSIVSTPAPSAGMAGLPPP